MMTVYTIAELVGENVSAADPFGEDMSGSLLGGYIPDRSVLFQPNVQLGDGLAGPANNQQLQIYRDTRPIAADELGMQGPFFLPEMAVARHRAGRNFPLNYEFGPAGLDTTNPGLLPSQQGYMGSPYGPGMLPAAHGGVPPVELIGDVNTVYYTASPAVNWQGY